MTKTSSAVRNISMKTPWATVVPAESVVETFKGPGKRPAVTAAAAMDEMIWAMKVVMARNPEIAPMRYIPKQTWSDEFSKTGEISGHAAHLQAYRRIEQSTTDSEKRPSINGQRESKG